MHMAWSIAVAMRMVMVLMTMSRVVAGLAMAMRKGQSAPVGGPRKLALF
jgi:hypothetical protein